MILDILNKVFDFFLISLYTIMLGTLKNIKIYSVVVLTTFLVLRPANTIGVILSDMKRTIERNKISFFHDLVEYLR